MSEIFKARNRPMAFLVFANTDDRDEKFILTALIPDDDEGLERVFYEIFKTLRQKHSDKHFIIEGGGIIEVEELTKIIHVSRLQSRFGPASESALRKLLKNTMTEENLNNYRLVIIEMKP